MDDEPLKSRVSTRAAWPRWILRWATILGLTFVIVAAIMYFQQESLIFPGARMTQGRRPVATAGEEIVTLHAADGQRVTMRYGQALDAVGQPRGDAAERPVLLFFYGNGQCAEGCRDLSLWFRSLGLNVAIADYLGYGASEGSPSETGCYATADAAYDWLVDQQHVEPSRIIVAGWSLGGGVAIDLGAREPVGGLIVFSTFTSVTDMAQQMYPWLPVRWFLKHRFDSRSKIARVTCPIVLGHGTQDTLIPCEMCEELGAALGREATVFYVEGAGHNDFMDRGHRQVAEQLMRLIAAVDQSSPMSPAAR